jgi:hypothetical protein
MGMQQGCVARTCTTAWQGDQRAADADGIAPASGLGGSRGAAGKKIGEIPLTHGPGKETERPTNGTKSLMSCGLAGWRVGLVGPAR